MKSIEQKILKKINNKSFNYFLKDGGDHDGTINHFYENIKDHDIINVSALMFFLLYDKKRNFGLEKNEISYLVKNSDLKLAENGTNLNVLLMHIAYNGKNEVNLSAEDVDYLLKNSDLNHKNYIGESALICFLTHNNQSNEQSLFDDGQIDYLIENSELPKTIWYGAQKTCPIVAAAECNHNDTIILKLVKKRIKEDPKFFNKTYFKKIRNNSIHNKIQMAVDSTLTKEEICKKINTADTTKKNKI